MAGNAGIASRLLPPWLIIRPSARTSRKLAALSGKAARNPEYPMLSRPLTVPLTPAEERALLMVAYRRFAELEGGPVRRLLALGLIDETGETFALTPAGQRHVQGMASNVVVGPWGKRGG